MEWNGPIMLAAEREMLDWIGLIDGIGIGIGWMGLDAGCWMLDGEW